MYENLNSKYRPSNLGEVLGQDTIKTTLANAVKLGRVAHSYVFYGPRGCGKTTIARILAKTLNCHHPKNGAPCGKCPSCVEITESKSLDVIEIDAASNTQVDKVRSVIIEQVDFAPSRDKYKIYILDEVHMLSPGSFNALLKTVEEPPKHVVFIMATTEQQKVPPTILSRSQCFRFRPLTEACMTQRLTEIAAKEKIKAEPEALKLMARAADGAMRDALTMLDRAASFGHGEVKTEVLNELLGHPGPELVEALALALVNRDAAGLHSSFDRLNAEGYDPVAALRNLRNLFAEAFMAVQGFSKEPVPIKGLPAQFPPAALARISRKLTVIIEEIKFSDALAIAAEIALFTLIETPVELESLVRRLEGLEGRLAADPAYPVAIADLQEQVAKLKALVDAGAKAMEGRSFQDMTEEDRAKMKERSTQQQAIMAAIQQNVDRLRMRQMAAEYNQSITALKDAQASAQKENAKETAQKLGQIIAEREKQMEEKVTAMEFKAVPHRSRNTY